MSRVAVVCGVPKQHCKGSLKRCSAGIKGRDTEGGIMIHGSSAEAFNCYKCFLVKILGYKQISPREFENPETHRITVLSKKNSFGAVLRRGKAGEQGTGRVMPKDFLNGLIIKT